MTIVALTLMSFVHLIILPNGILNVFFIVATFILLAIYNYFIYLFNKTKIQI